MTEPDVERQVGAMHTAVAEIGAVVGGHTEVTPAVDRPVAARDEVGRLLSP